MAAVWKCRCESMNPGQTKESPRSITSAPSPHRPRTSPTGPTSAIRSPAIATAPGCERSPSAVKTAELLNTRSANMEPPIR